MSLHNKKDIAIVGISGKFPGSNTPNELWKNLLSEQELIKFYSDDVLRKKGVREEDILDPAFVKADAKIDNAESFDFSFFNYTPGEAASMDPQIRLFHEQAWKALEDAGYNPYVFNGKIGLFACASDNLNWRINSLISKNTYVDSFFQSQISNNNFLATLVAYKLNLKGPSYFLDTACSSSLSAVHLACRNLWLRECDMALAGGISVSSTTQIGYQFKEGMVNSRDGHCRAFDINSSGIVSGEGVGIIVLKRLSDAVASNDHVYAVIKSSAVNNDGSGKPGYTTPSINGQMACIQSALKAGSIDPSSISYVETHGTGTQLGDPIEINSLNLGYTGYGKDRCPIGTVKNNLGHLDVASGITGLIKTAYILKYKKIPPTINYETPNPKIDFEGGPFYVNTEALDLVRKEDHALRAAVSSFGIGGTNAHVILEEFRPDHSNRNLSSKPYEIIGFSALTPKALNSYSQQLLMYLEENKNINMSCIANTLRHGKNYFPYKRFFVCENREVAISRLKNGAFTDGVAKTKDCIENMVFMCSGQGGQYYDMTKDLYRENVYFRGLMNQGFQLLESLSEVSYKSILFPEESDTSDSLSSIGNTLFTQPLLFLVEYCMGRMLMHFGIQPNFLIGYSLGEFVAATLSGVFSFDTGLKLVYERAELMSKIDGGSMLAILTTKQEIEQYLDPEVSIAAINAEDLLVVSGENDKIGLLEDVIKSNGIVSIKLKVSHAFHSQMMESMEEDFFKVLSEVEYGEMQIPIISCVTGQLLDSKIAKTPEYWIDHLLKQVQFSKAITHLLGMDKLAFVELGPGQTMMRLVHKNDRSTDKNPKLFSTIRQENERINDFEKLATLLGALWSNEYTLDWDQFYNGDIPSKVPVPTYCFEEHLFPARVDLQDTMTNVATPKKRKLGTGNEDWFYLPDWKRSFVNYDGEIVSSKNFILFSDDSLICEQLISGLQNDGKQLVVVRRGNDFIKESPNHFIVDPSKDEHFKKLYDALPVVNTEIDQFIFAWTLLESKIDFLKNSHKEILDYGNAQFFELLAIMKNFRLVDSQERLKVTLLSNLNYNVSTTIPPAQGPSTATSLLTTLKLENPSVFCSQVDMNFKEQVNAVDTLLEEIYFNYEDEVAVYRNDQRWIRKYEPVSLSLPSKHKMLKLNGVYVVSGGLGTLGFEVTRYLLDELDATVIMLGRSQLPPKDDWKKIIDQGAKSHPLYNKVKKLYSLNDMACVYKTCDIANTTEFTKTMLSIQKEYGRVNGFIHLAGVTDASTFKPLEYINKEIVEKQFQPKLLGLINVYRFSLENTFDFVWISSSLSSVLGGLTYGTYAAANLALDAFVDTYHDELPNWYCVNLDGMDLSRIKNASSNVILDIFRKSFQIGKNPRLVISFEDLNLKMKRLNEPSKIEGKVEFKAMASRTISDIPYKKPTTETELKLQEIWQEFFGIETIGTKDDFFKFGGDSLKAMTLLKRYQKVFNVIIDIHEFYNKPTIHAMAQEIDIALQIAEMEKTVKNNDLNEMKI